MKMGKFLFYTYEMKEMVEFLYAIIKKGLNYEVKKIKDEGFEIELTGF